MYRYISKTVEDRYTVTIRNRTLGAIYRMVALLVTLNDLRSLQVL